jgi:zinc/manganese transport system permease protein
MGDILSFLLLPFLACLVITGLHCYFGMHIVKREVIFVDLALAQVAALGGAVAQLLGYDIGLIQAKIFSLIFAVAGAGIFSFTRTKNKQIPQEAIIGIVYAVSAALMLLVLARAPEGAEHVKELTFGSILTVTWSDIIKTALLYVVIGIFHFIYRKKFHVISFEPERAQKEGISIRLWDFFFYASFGFMVTQSVGIAGVLLVFSFLIVPAVCAIMFVSHNWTRLILGWVLGFIASVVGLSLSVKFDLPSAATIVAAFGLVLVISILLRIIITKFKTV